MTTLGPNGIARRSPFPNIGDYGFLSDCESMALVAPSGNVEWLCLPRVDSPSVFGSLLDRHAGGFRLGPADLQVPVHWWHGDADHIVPFEHGVHTVGRLPDAELHVLPGESHLGGLGAGEEILVTLTTPA